MQPIICKFVVASSGNMVENTCDILATGRDTGEHMGAGAQVVQRTQQFVVFEPKLKAQYVLEIIRR